MHLVCQLVQLSVLLLVAWFLEANRSSFGLRRSASWFFVRNFYVVLQGALGGLGGLGVVLWRRGVRGTQLAVVFPRVTLTLPERALVTALERSICVRRWCFPLLFDLKFGILVPREDSERNFEDIFNVERLTPGLFRVSGDEARKHGSAVVGVEAHPEHFVPLLWCYTASVVKILAEYEEPPVVIYDVFFFAHLRPGRVACKFLDSVGGVPAFLGGADVRFAKVLAELIPVLVFVPIHGPPEVPVRLSNIA